MSAKIILPPVEISARAPAILAVNAAGDRSRQHAFNKAAFMLAREAVEIMHSFDGFLITSASRAGIVHRVSHLHGCSCEAGVNGRVCWHAALVEVLEESGKYVMPALPPPETAPSGRPMGERLAAARAERFTAALHAVNELFG
jgi:hypothetical protein